MRGLRPALREGYTRRILGIPRPHGRATLRQRQALAEGNLARVEEARKLRAAVLDLARRRHSTARIAAWLGCSKSTVRRHLHVLREAGDLPSVCPRCGRPVG